MSSDNSFKSKLQDFAWHAKRRFGGFFSRVESSLTDVSNGLNFLFWFPFVDWKRAKQSAKGIGFRWVLFPLGIIPVVLAIVGKILFSPVELLMELFRGRLKGACLRIPALLTLAALIFTITSGWWNGFGVSKDRYVKNLTTTLNEQLVMKDFDGASETFDELMKQDSDVDAQSCLKYINGLIEKDDQEKLKEVLDELAPGPDRPPGLKEAHQLMAINLSKALRPQESNQLQLLKWHLNHSGDPKTLDAHLAWAAYAVATNNEDDAIESFRAAAEFDPNYLLNLVMLYQRQGETELRDKVLVRAREVFGNKLSDSPDDDKSRIVLSGILMNLQDFEGAQKMLVDGVERTGSSEIKMAYSSFLIKEFIRTARENPYSENVSLVEKSIRISPDNPLAQRGFNRLYALAKSDQEKEILLEALESLTLNEPTCGQANFILGVLHWLEGRKLKAIEYSEKSYALSSSDSSVCNNLAFQLANVSSPDLDRALQLSRSAVESDATNSEFRDTLGTVLIKMENYKEATLELEKALQGRPGSLSLNSKIDIHEKLSLAYDKLGFADLSKIHADNAIKTRESRRN
jgi:tetratricopeptide (TPR) repeat protein